MPAGRSTSFAACSRWRPARGAPPSRCAPPRRPEIWTPSGFWQAVISREGRSLDACAVRLHVPADVLSAVAAVASTPLLHAVRRAWESRVPSDWAQGYCPICGEWATLAEARGLERRRRLRCARCGGDWRGDWLRCVYCANTDHTTLGVFAPDAALETRTIETCARCGGYVKTLATLQGTAAEAVALLDLATVELDIAALEPGMHAPGPAGVRRRACASCRPSHDPPARGALPRAAVRAGGRGRPPAAARAQHDPRRDRHGDQARAARARGRRRSGTRRASRPGCWSSVGSARPRTRRARSGPWRRRFSPNTT